MRTVVGYLAHLRLFGLYFWALRVVFRQILSVSFQHECGIALVILPRLTMRNTPELPSATGRVCFGPATVGDFGLGGSVSRAPLIPLPGLSVGV